MAVRVRRILVTGSRNWLDQGLVYRTLQGELAAGPFTLVHGACPTGLDDIADRWAWGVRQQGGQVEIDAHPAQWDAYGKGAGPIRNQEMVDRGAEVCHAFPLGESRGTWDCMRRARRADIHVINHGDVPFGLWE